MTRLARRPTSRHVKIALAVFIGGGAAVLSYSHGLEITRELGTRNWLAYVVPLLPDGLIGLSSAELYDAAKDAGARGSRPAAALIGLVVGVVVTIVMNVAAAWHLGWGARLLNALAPVALLIAVWVLEGGFRRVRMLAAQVILPAGCGHVVPPGATRQAMAVATWAHIADCEGGKPSHRELGRRLGVHHKIAGDLLRAAGNGGAIHAS